MSQYKVICRTTYPNYPEFQRIFYNLDLAKFYAKDPLMYELLNNAPKNIYKEYLELLDMGEKFILEIIAYNITDGQEKIIYHFTQ